MAETEKELAAMAARLSASQKRAMLWMNTDGSPRDEVKGSPSPVSFYCLQKVIIGDPAQKVSLIYSLCKQGSSATSKRGLWPANTWALTPLGQQFRAHLQDQPK